MTEEMPVVRIENWYFNKQINNLEGNVYGHPRFADGTYVYTSNIQAWSESRVVTRNTVYVLGQQLSAEETAKLDALMENYQHLILGKIN